MHKQKRCIRIKPNSFKKRGYSLASLFGDGKHQPPVSGNKSQVLDEAQVTFNLVQIIRRALKCITPRLVVLMQLLTFGYASLWQLRSNASLVANVRSNSMGSDGFL